MTNERTSEQRSNIVHTGEPTPSPPSPLPDIQIFSMPSALTEPVGSYLTDASLHSLTTQEKAAVALALDKCAKLAELPATLRHMGLEEVMFQPGAKLARTCDGQAKEWIAGVIGALFESARRDDIPAMLSLIYLLDPGG